MRRPDLRRPFPPTLAKRLNGARIGALRRRGKYILIELDETGLLLLHLGMSGRITAGGAEIPAVKHDHVVLTLDDGTVVRFNDPRRFGLDRLHDARCRGRCIRYWPGWVREPLEPGFDGAYLSRVLAGKLTSIKAALLDQKIVAGLGNIYVCEALYRAGLSPRRLAATVTGPRAVRLAAGDPRCSRRGDRGGRIVAARLCPGERRTRLFPAPLGGLRQGGRTLPRLHLRRGRAPDRPGRSVDVLLRQAPALAARIEPDDVAGPAVTSSAPRS